MKFFEKVKEIRSRFGELHFERYAIVETFLFSIYIHTIHKADEDKHLHSHPWNFVTMVLSGKYLARTNTGLTTKNPLSLSVMTRKGFHKIDKIIKGPVKTIFFAFGVKKPWYYLVDNNRIEHNLYRKMKSMGIFNE